MKRLVLPVTVFAIASGLLAALGLGMRDQEATVFADRAVSSPGASAYWQKPLAGGSEDLREAGAEQTLRKRPSPTSAGPDNRYCATGDIPQFGSNDGPAQLPRKCLYTARDATPSPGKIIAVKKGENLNDAIAGSSCGDIIELQAGLTYAGPTTIPSKPCDDQHWITIRTSGWRGLPPEGIRVTPCYGGVLRLRGRPAYPCSHAENLLAKLLVANVGDEMHFLPGANHYRFIGIEFTRETGTGPVSQLVALGTASKIIFDQSWFHGDDDSSGDETKRGIDLAQSYLVAVIDSYFNDFYCISGVGTCTDAQAILGGIGAPSGNWGGYKIVNNFLEAAGENLLFGGEDSTTATPADIEIRRNHLFKPFIWMPGDPSYDGGVISATDTRSFSAKNLADLKRSVRALLAGPAQKPKGRNPVMVKNLFELKNASRVLVEGNVMENSWGGFSQNGPGILLTPQVFQVCHTCLVGDVTIRYDLVRNTGQPFQIANIFPSAGHNYSLHDVVADHIEYLPGCYGGSCTPYFNEIIAGENLASEFQVHDVSINHITEVLDNQLGTSLLALAGPSAATGSQMYNLRFENSIVPAGQYGIMDAGGGPNDCATKPSASVPKLQSCFRNLVFGNNAIPYAGAGAGGEWGKGNFLVDDQNAVGFVGISDLDFHLSHSSRFKKKGTDGKDLGADIDALESATSGVD